MKTVLAMVLAIMSAAVSSADAGLAMPPLTHTQPADWLNSRPLDWAQLRGKVVLLQFWTFDCSNCRGSIPWLRAVEEKYRGRDFVIVGVHTPELRHEYERDRVIAKVRHYALNWPQMIDNDYSYWNAMGNQYWPAFYVVDKAGRLRAEYFGETHPGDPRAQRIEASIEALLDSPI